MSRRILRFVSISIVSTALLSACGSSDDADNKAESAEVEEATPVSEPIIHKFLDDGKIWLPNEMRCGSLASYNDDRFLKFNSTENGKPFFWGPFFFGPYTISGSELAGYKINVSVPNDYNPDIGMEGSHNLIWDGGAESVTIKIGRVGENLSFGGKLYHSCGNNDLVE